MTTIFFNTQLSLCFEIKCWVIFWNDGSLLRCGGQTSSISQQIQLDMIFNTNLDPLVVVFWRWSFECVSHPVGDSMMRSRCQGDVVFRVWWPFNPPWILARAGIVHSFASPFFKPLCFPLLFILCCFLFVSCISFHAFCRRPWDETWAHCRTEWINFEDSTRVSSMGFLPGRAARCQ